MSIIVIVIAAFLGVYAMESSGKDWIRIEGVVLHQVIDERGNVSREWNKSFHVLLSQCQWLIQTADPTADQKTAPSRMTEITFEDGTMFQLSTYRGQTNYVSTTNFTGRITQDSIPRDDARLCNYVWMAFASGCYFSQQTNRWIYPIWELDDRTLRDNGFRMEARWILGGEREPPDYVCYINDGVDRLVNTKGESIERHSRPPYDLGYTNAIYKAERKQSIRGMSIPMEFSFVRYMKPVFELDPTNTMGVIPRTSTFGRVEKVTVVEGPEKLRPEFDGTVSIVDSRFSESMPPVPALVYPITNGFWPDLQEVVPKYEQYARSLEQSATRTEKQDAEWRLRIVRWLLVGIATGLAFVFLIKCRNS